MKLIFNFAGLVILCGGEPLKRLSEPIIGSRVVDILIVLI